MRSPCWIWLSATAILVAVILLWTDRADMRIAEVKKAEIDEAYGQVCLSFEANRGQTDARARFLCRGPGYTLFLGPNEVALESRTAVLRMKLAGANRSPEVVGLDELPGKVNYFTGNDPEKWRSNIPTYARVQYQSVYPGVDLVYYGNQRQLEYDFIVAPGADPNTIRLRFEGADKLELDAQGNLILHAAGGDVIQRAPNIYQEIDGIRQTVRGGYILSETAGVKSQTENPDVGFQVADYDPSRPLIIDPVLVYSTYLGGSGDDRFPIIVVDAAGQVYLTGQSSSRDFPTSNPAQPGNGGGSFDLFVAKLNATGTALVYATYLGGSGEDSFASIAVDQAGSAYVNGRTSSRDLPTVNPLQKSFGGGPFDAFVAKLNATGSALVYSTYLGGSGRDESWDIKVDAAGNAYVAGFTSSTSFPTVNPLQPTYGGGPFDVFVAKLNAGGTALVYSTYLGGDGSEMAPNLAVDIAGNVYIHGQTGSLDFPTVNPLQPTYGGGPFDVFVDKLNATGTALVYSTYLGGGGSEQARAIIVDGAGNAYVTGFTSSTDYPTRNPLQPTYGGGSLDGFVAKLNAAGAALIYSTYLGGNGRDGGEGLGLDAAGNLCVAGFTSSTNFPTVNPLQAKFGGPPGGGEIGRDGWVAKLKSDGSALIYSTYLGGSEDEEATWLGVDAAGNAYVTGQTSSIDFPTMNPLQPTYGGGRFDIFVAKISD